MRVVAAAGEGGPVCEALPLADALPQHWGLRPAPAGATGGFAWRRDAEEGWGAPQRPPPV